MASTNSASALIEYGQQPSSTWMKSKNYTSMNILGLFLCNISWLHAGDLAA